MGGDDDDDDEVNNELGDEDDARGDKAARKAAKKELEKSKRAGLRQELTDLKGKLDLDDANRTPQMGEALAEFYSRTSQYWNDEAAARIAQENAASLSETEKLSSKELKREGFNLASERYEELKPVLERLDELELQQREAEEQRKQKKEKKQRKERPLTLVRVKLHHYMLPYQYLWRTSIRITRKHGCFSYIVETKIQKDNSL